ncbi:MAG TPA: transcriptional regulator [Leeuwenhoekiella sp.]|nr:transcriptional regulator [Leeuwenhoekiella sp.]
MNEKQLKNLVLELTGQPKECEWIEFKKNNSDPVEIGKRISALSNGACIHNQDYGYLVYGVEDDSHKIVGSSFKCKLQKKGNEELEHWLIQRLNPRIDFTIKQINIEDKNICIFIIPSAHNQPVEFTHKAYVRIGSITRELSEFPEKARKIWKKGNSKVFELRIAQESISGSDIVELLSTQTYFELLNIPYPSSRDGVLKKFVSEDFIIKNKSKYHITNLGAILLAKDLNNFSELKRKAIRAIVYDGNNKLNTIREQIGVRGYAVGFEGLVNWVNSQLPANEVIGKALRDNVRMYPEIAIRELIANMIIHQDFEEKGFPMVEIYSDRIEITNPGLAMITPNRFIDEYLSRNEKLADIMRRFRICEEKGSGIDKVIAFTEHYQLPAPNFLIQEKHTKTIMYSYQSFNDMEKNDKIRACYQHACLKYVTNEKMTNQSLRERFKIESKNAAIISRVIRDTLEESLIKDDDPSTKSRKYAKYIPFWA